MNVFLWVVQALLAAIFVMSGLQKLAQPKNKLAGKYPWVKDVSLATLRFIGVMELLGAIGLVVPAAIGIAHVLTPIAGAGLAILMLLAMAMHVRRKESSAVPVTTILLVLATFVSWGRFGPYGW
ncbi:DoxX family protein [Actinomadura sp. 6K520]|uniref:DoxX family protein n=1 Tax=Actinomadura sp. 6K520 TaxID=2530364 RepID=UPI00104806FF|nr:DoxX family protein [Actinomadura sp. 6K520]TDE27646.1 DoxX family protein [Actinomadura sp. 6K520]